MMSLNSSRLTVHSLTYTEPGFWMVKHQLVVFILKMKMAKADLGGSKRVIDPLENISSSCIHKYNKQNKQYMTV